MSSKAAAKAQVQEMKPFVISRTFKASRERLWKAFTELEQMKQWFGPKGFTAKYAKQDFRPGGVYHYQLVSPEGHEMWGKMAYREIVPPSRIVFVNSFSDAEGGLTRHPMSPGWPQQMLTTVTFTEEGDKTRFTVEWLPIDPSDEEWRTFDQGRDSMKQGWTGTFEQLEEYLAKN
ncbi:MAG: SRPBCC domain-containing protein [Xanthobacteraceae bacterium]